MRTMRLGLLISLLCLFLVGNAAHPYGTYPIYGTSLYGDGEEDTIKNGKGMYSVELLYTEHYANPAGEIAKIQNIVNKGFKVILRIDCDWNARTVPLDNDTAGRTRYAQICGQIARDMGDLVHIYVIGNEMQAEYAGYITKEWYTQVFNDTYDQIKAANPDAQVCMGGLGGWPGFESEPSSNISYFNYFINNVRAVDGFSVHAYSGRSLYNYESPLEDPRFSDMTGLKSFSEYCKRIYAKWGAWAKPIYITETNTYWFSTSFACYSYEDDWMKKAFQTIDDWNQSNDMKVDALCWFVYHNYGFTEGDQWGDALERTDDPKLNRAREDFAWTTANTDYTPGTPGSTLRFQAENYTNSDLWGDTNGLEGTDYHDNSYGNYGGKYRNEGVDIDALPDGSGYFVGWMEPGEWTRYETVSGGYNYRIRLRYSRLDAGNAMVHFTVDGATVGGNISLPSTGDWNTYAVVTGTASFPMAPGTHEIKMVADTSNFNVDYFEFVVNQPSSVPTLTAIPADGRIRLSWTNPPEANFAGTMIRYKTTGYPANALDGTLLCDRAAAPSSTDSIIHTGLTNGVTYYYAAFSHDGVPRYAASRRIAIKPAGRTMGQAKQLADGTPVGLVGRIVTAVFSADNCIYVQEPDRSSGIRVAVTNPEVSVGDVIDVYGTMSSRKPDGINTAERQIDAVEIVKTSTDTPRPLYMPCRSVGGQAVDGGAGLSNIGLLVRIAGKVTSKEGSCLWVDDGSGVVVVNCPSSDIPAGIGDKVKITGVIEGNFAPGSTSNRRYIHIREWSDLVRL